MGTNWMRKTTKKKRTKKTSDAIFEFPPFPLLSFGRLTGTRWMVVLLAIISLAGGFTAPACGQDHPNSHANDFVIFATIFTDQGFALPGAKVRVRRTDEQKFRWEAMSDQRGELGIRVKQGAEYEVTIAARGFKPETRKVDAREGNREDLTLQLERLGGGK